MGNELYTSTLLSRLFFQEFFGNPFTNFQVNLTKWDTFTGREYLERLGMYDYRARIYDPGVGRFIQIDPLCGCTVEVECANKYIYVMNNPIMFKDPTGEWRLSFDICASHIAAIIAAASTFISGGTLSAAVATASSILASGRCKDVCVRILGNCEIRRSKIKCNFGVSKVFGRACI